MESTALARPGSRRFRVTSAFTRDEIRDLVRVSSWRGLAGVALTWALIGGALAIVAYAPSVVTVAAALVLIGGQQLALAVLMHEASHGLLAWNRTVNNWVGQWLCAYPVWLDVVRYRESHLRHHNRLGHSDDPDLPLVSGLPLSRRALVRKLALDLVGVTGLMRSALNLMTDLGFTAYSVAGKVERIARPRSMSQVVHSGLRPLGGMIVTQLAFLGVLALAGHAELYAVWVGAWLTTSSVFHRIRALHEHGGCVMDPEDPLRNTRTTLAGPLARLTVAPHHANYHIEHHMLMTVPCYRLPGLHRLLVERHLLAQACIASGYGAVMKDVSSVVPSGDPHRQAS